MTPAPGTYRPTRPGWHDRVVTHVSDTAVTFYFAGTPDRTIADPPEVFRVWCEVAGAVLDSE